MNDVMLVLKNLIDLSKKPIKFEFEHRLKGSIKFIFLIKIVVYVETFEFPSN